MIERAIIADLFRDKIPRSRLTSDIDDKACGRSAIVTLTQIMGAFVIVNAERSDQIYYLYLHLHSGI